VPARLFKIKYITIRVEKVASPITALQCGGATYYLPTPHLVLIFAVHFLLSYLRSQTQITLPSHVKVCLLHNSCVKIDPRLFE